MENAKEDLKETYSSYLEKGLSSKEALEKAVKEVKERHGEEEFKGALGEFLRELLESYKPENLPEADPLLSFIESLYQEYDLLKPKLKWLLGRLRSES